MHTVACVLKQGKHDTFFLPSPQLWESIGGKQLALQKSTSIETLQKAAEAKVMQLIRPSQLVQPEYEFVHLFHDSNDTVKFVFAITAKGEIVPRGYQPTVIEAESYPFSALIRTVEDIVCGRLNPDDVLQKTRKWGT